MHIRLGYEMVFQVPARTPMLLMLFVHPSRTGELLQPDRVLVEPACGATLAAIYSRNQSIIAGFEAPLAVVCGGATVAYEQIRDWRAKAAAQTRHGWTRK